jgi:hypothetical protein
MTNGRAGDWNQRASSASVSSSLLGVTMDQKTSVAEITRSVSVVMTGYNQSAAPLLRIGFDLVIAASAVL